MARCKSWGHQVRDLRQKWSKHLSNGFSNGLFDAVNVNSTIVNCMSTLFIVGG